MTESISGHPCTCTTGESSGASTATLQFPEIIDLIASLEIVELPEEAAH